MRYIYITSFGEVEERLLLGTAKNVKEVFGLDVRLSAVPFPPRLGFKHGRNQHSATAILRYLESLSFPDMLRLLAIVGFDLYEEGHGFVFGKAQPGGRSAVVSVFRLQSKDEKLFFERTFKEVNYRLGLTFGLTYCTDSICVMSFSNYLAELDRKTRFLCGFCRRRLSATLDL